MGHGKAKRRRTNFGEGIRRAATGKSFYLPQFDPDVLSLDRLPPAHAQFHQLES